MPKFPALVCDRGVSVVSTQLLAISTQALELGGTARWVRFFGAGGRSLMRAVLCSAGTIAENRERKGAVCDSREWVRLFSPGVEARKWVRFFGARPRDGAAQPIALWPSHSGRGNQVVQQLGASLRRLASFIHIILLGQSPWLCTAPAVARCSPCRHCSYRNAGSAGHGRRP